MKKFCELSHKMKNAKLYRITSGQLEFDVAVELGAASLQFFVVSKDQKFMAGCVADYHVK